MTTRSGVLLYRKFREYLIPTLLTSASISLATVIDSIIVGRLLGESALSAIGLAAPVIYGVNALFVLFVVGGVTRASVARGQRDNEGADRVFTQTFVVGTIAMSLLAIALWVFLWPLTRALAHGDAALAESTHAFLQPLVFTGPFMLVSMGMAQFARADGFPRFAAAIALIANAVNLILSYTFIRFLRMGIAGSGLSTTLGYAFGVIVVLFYMHFKKRSFHFRRIGQRDISSTRRILATGLPEMLTQGLSFLRTLIINILIVRTLGSLGLASLTICTNALMIAMVFIGGTSSTMLPIVGTLFGETDYQGIRYTVRTGLRFVAIAALTIMALFLAFPNQISRAFGVTSPEGLASAAYALRIYALSLPLAGVNTILQSFFQTTGRTRLAATIAVMRGLLYVVLFAFALSNVAGRFIWFAFLLAEAATLVSILVMGARIRRRESAQGMLLLRSRNEAETVVDTSIPASVENATMLSKEIVQAGVACGLPETSALRLGLAAEEMAVNIAQYGHVDKKGEIDVLLKLSDGEAILRVRDNGNHFDPTKYYSNDGSPEIVGPALGGLEVVRRISDKVEYSHGLGFNVTVITVSCAALEALPQASN